MRPRAATRLDFVIFRLPDVRTGAASRHRIAAQFGNFSAFSIAWKLGSLGRGSIQGSAFRYSRPGFVPAAVELLRQELPTAEVRYFDGGRFALGDTRHCDRQGDHRDVLATGPTRGPAYGTGPPPPHARLALLRLIAPEAPAPHRRCDSSAAQRWVLKTASRTVRLLATLPRSFGRCCSTIRCQTRAS